MKIENISKVELLITQIREIEYFLKEEQNTDERIEMLTRCYWPDLTLPDDKDVASIILNYDANIEAEVTLILRNKIKEIEEELKKL